MPWIKDYQSIESENRSALARMAYQRRRLMGKSVPQTNVVRVAGERKCPKCNKIKGSAAFKGKVCVDCK